ncbi:hypothetical protein GALMADRAFT_264905 [Galerina marginata CBS 339.88]|uniref:F-box domain-containing protein n=1 Tax=Galerina marginata (strain CBS 339.88) TaxID=685588 RepID=A0A067TCX2_GALM3|nr:hypothetical protein GALMADRAFT_264905 [Galerina marginata CBS 339.88]
MSQRQRKSRRRPASKLINGSSKPSTVPSIPQLSADVLCLIFKHARPDESEADAQADSEALPRYPYNLAAVCKEWREALFLNPAFSVASTFYVDSINPTPPHHVISFLEWSKHLMITVEVKRSPEAEAEAANSDRQEGKRTRAIINALKPHVHRCLSITFDVIHGSSLPSLSRDLFDISPHLQELVLRCKSDDGPPARLEKIGPVQGLGSQPKPGRVLLSGHTIHDAIENVPQIFNCLTGTTSLGFCCFNYEKYSEFPTYKFATDLFDAFQYPDTLESGTLLNLNIPYETHQRARYLSLPRAKKLLLSGNNNSTMRTIFKHFDFRAVTSLSIEHCSLSGVSIIGDPGSLSLKGITSDLIEPLLSWRGSFIYLIDAPTATDTLLVHLTSSAVQHVFLDECPNISVGGLQRLCIRRKIPGHLQIMTLCVCGASPLTPYEDVKDLSLLVGEGFTGKSGYFEWRGHTLGCPHDHSSGDSPRPV